MVVSLSDLIEIAAIVLSIVALIVTVIGFFASLKFYRDGTELQASAQDVLAKISARTESIESHVGGMNERLLDYAFGQGDLRRQSEGDATVVSGVPHPTNHEAADSQSASQQESEVTQQINKYLSVKGWRVSDVRSGVASAIYQLGSALGFNLLEGNAQFIFLGVFTLEEHSDVVVKVRLLLRNIVQAKQRFESAPDQSQIDQGIALLRTLGIVVLTSDETPIQEMLKKAELSQPESFRVPIEMMTLHDLNDRVEEEYDRLGMG